MFTERSLSKPVEHVRTAYAPEAQVFDCDRDFETVPPAAAEDLGDPTRCVRLLGDYQAHEQLSPTVVWVTVSVGHISL